MTQHSSCWWLDLLKEELNSFPSHCYVKNLIQASLFLKNRSNVLWAKSNKSSSYSLSLGSSFVFKSEVDWIVRVIILHFLDRRIHFFFNPLWVTVGNWFNIFYSPSSWKFMWIRMAHGSSITARRPLLFVRHVFNLVPRPAITNASRAVFGPIVWAFQSNASFFKFSHFPCKFRRGLRRFQ